MGGASRWWLHYALLDLNKSLQGKLQVYRGDPLSILHSLVTKFDVNCITWNRCYEPWRIKRDASIKASLKKLGVDVQSFNGSLLWEPWHVLKKDGTPYKIFTPYYRRGCLSCSAPRVPLPIPQNISFSDQDNDALSVQELDLLPRIHWDAQMRERWIISEAAALERLDDFVINELCDYENGRNFPAKPHVSRLSAYLHFGQISPNTAWYRANSAGGLIQNENNLESFLCELGWREFSYYLLFHFPKLPYKNLQPRFDSFPWKHDQEDDLRAWQKGMTGYPLIDAGMRELYNTGYMHNRVRMVVGSFLVKNLLIHWHHGEHWFWDCLVDADLASNSASWQWIAGCGVDAAPFFRIFNPLTQSEKFDSQGHYIKHHIPELAKLPAQYIHAPWLAPNNILADADVKIGITYPAPIIDLKESRIEALEAFASTKLSH